MKGSYLILILLVVGIMVGPASGYEVTIYPKTFGHTARSADNSSFADLMAGAGTTSSWSGGTSYFTALTTTTTTQENLFYRNFVIGIATDTGSIIPDAAVIESAHLNISSSVIYPELGSSWTITAVNVIGGKFANTTNGSIGGGEYILRGTALESNNATYSDFVAAAAASNKNVTLTLTAAGIQNISKTSDTLQFLRLSDDLNGAFTGVWKTNSYEGVTIRPPTYATEGLRPYYVINYNEIAPVAAFSADDTTPSIGQTVTFTDVSVNATHWQWDFGDGSSSTDQNPTYVYNTSGTFTVKLTATNGIGSDDEEKVNYITVSTVTASCPVNLHTMFNVTGDGTDESAKIQAAFDYAGINAPCTITFPASKTITVNNYTIAGDHTEIDGQDSTIKIADDYAVTSSIMRFGDYNYVHDLKLDGNWHGINQSQVGNINGFRIGNYDVFENNEIFNTSAYSIHSYQTSHWTIRNNFIHDGRQYGIATGAGSLTVVSENVTVINNIIWNMSQSSIKIRGTGNSSILYNSILLLNGAGESSTGINLYSNDAKNNNILIDGNTISGDFTNTSRTGTGTSTGIGADPPDNLGSVIQNNTINETYRGIRIQCNFTVVRENEISNSEYSGLEITGNSNFATENILTNTGIFVTGVTHTATNNTFTHNIVYGGNQYSKALGDGSFLWYNGERNIFDFNVFNVDRYGFHINSTYGTVNGTTISNNVITAGGACIYDEGTGTVQTNNTCNGAMDPVIVKFTGVQSIPSVGHKQVVLTDGTTGPTILSRVWNFTNTTGNNTPVTFSTSQNPTITFGVGNYSIRLNASGALESNTTAANAYFVNVSASDSSSVPTADFTANATTVCYGATVSFTDASTNASSWSWSFGDGATSTTQSPAHTYNISSGYFTVALTTTNGIGTDTETKTNYINVQGSCSGGSTTPAAHPFSSTTGTSSVVTALGLIGLAIIGFGVAIVVGSFATMNTKGLVAGIAAIIIGSVMLIVSYMFLSPLMNLVA